MIKFTLRMLNLNITLKLFLFALVALLFTNCTQYQFVTIESQLNKDEHQAFVYETDTAIITYSFRGRGCPINISVFNKTNEPLYIDWHKSAVIVRGERISYWADETTINGHISGIEVDYNHNLSTTDAKLHGKMYRDEQRSFIPPQSYVNYIPIRLKNSFFDMGNGTQSEKVTLPGYNGKVTGKSVQFDKDYSPFTFRSYLTLSMDEEFSKKFYIDHEFWVSTITETNQGPSAINLSYDNMYHVSKSTGVGGAGCFFLGVGAIALMALEGAEIVEETP